jgi:rubrerythrin
VLQDAKENDMSEKGITQIIEQAIGFEQDAYEFYNGAVKLVEQPHIREVLLELASEETKHKQKLQALLKGGNIEKVISVKRPEIEDLKLAEYLVLRPLDANATFQDVLVAAMHREKSSHDFYTAMAGITQDEVTRDLFEFLAREELGHKNKVESIYDQVIYQEF